MIEPATEWLRTSRHGRIEALLKLLQKQFVVEELAGSTESHIYYDTFDWRLYRRNQLFYRCGNRLRLIGFNGRSIADATGTGRSRLFWWDIVDSSLKEELRGALEMLNDTPSSSVNMMPQVSFLQIKDSGTSRFATLIRNNAHLNITSLFSEQKNRKPDEDRLSVVAGFLGAYPNTFFVMDRSRLSDFVDRVGDIRDESDYASLLGEYGIRRTHPDFWKYSDAFQEAHLRAAGAHGGILDYGRLENR